MRSDFREMGIGEMLRIIEEKMYEVLSLKRSDKGEIMRDER